MAYIPPNMDGDSLFITKRKIIDASVTAGPIALIAFITKMLIPLLLTLIVAAIFLFGRGRFSWSEWIEEYINFKRHRKDYYIKIPTPLIPKPKSRKEKKREEKEEKKEKKKKRGIYGKK